MSVSGNADVVEIEVLLRARVDESSVQEQQQQSEQQAENLSDDVTGGEGQDANVSDSLQNLDDALGQVDKQGLGNLKSFASNPAGTVENEMLGVLGKAGPYGALAVTIIGLVISSPEVFKAFVKFLGQKGGPLNQDYHRDFDGEVQAGFDRELQFRRAAGLDVVIINTDRDFILSDPAFTTNSLVDVEQTRFNRISSQETQWGYANST